jgi:putative transcriptional regulator
MGCAIRNRIRDLRAAAGDMTQQALADRIGVTRQTVNAIELGKYSPSLEVAFRIARVFATPIDDVFAFDERADRDGSPPL